MTDPPDPNATAAYQPNPPTAPAGERFAPGALLAGRYRLVAALGVCPSIAFRGWIRIIRWPVASGHSMW